MATTPPLRTSAQTPSTPLHGAKYDQHRPRKSTRHTSSRVQRAIETPPPNSDNIEKVVPSTNRKRPSTSRSAAHTYSPPSSAHTSPRKSTARGRLASRKSDTRTMDGARSSSEGIGSMQNSDRNPFEQQPSLKAATNMLPTPVKTPRKKPVQAKAVNAVARQLFSTVPPRPDSVEDAMPTPRKRMNKRHVGFSLYSSMEDEEEANHEGQIQIYTDSKEKVPVLDPTEDNPFYEPPEQRAPPPEPSKGRSSRKRKAAPNAEDRKEVKEAFDRKEGMVYVFRGKKVFRKFPTSDPEDDEESISDLDPAISRPLTRSSIKPRLLFPTPKQRQEREAATISDEEATTDIDEHHDDIMTDPEEEKEPQVTTPVKQTIFSPATPPTTGHATRSATKKVTESGPPIPFKGKKVSPFDGWTRTKAGMGASSAGARGKKRDAAAMEVGDVGGGQKRVRGNSVV